MVANTKSPSQPTSIPQQWGNHQKSTLHRLKKKLNNPCIFFWSNHSHARTKKQLKIQFLSWKIYNASDFDFETSSWIFLGFVIYKTLDFKLETFKGIRLRIQTMTKCQTWNKIFATRQILNKKFYNVSGIELKYIQRVRFWIEDFITRLISISIFHSLLFWIFQCTTR